MKRFDRIRRILDDAVGGATFGAHGAFWRGLTRDAFVAKSVFGLPLVVPGDPDGSNLIKAVEGREPFGQDAGTAGAMYRRMPAGRAPIPQDRIAFLRAWVADGCPDDDVIDPLASIMIDSQDHPPLDPVKHNAFWRDFDNWAMFEATEDVQASIGAFFAAAPLWMKVANGSVSAANWETAIRAPDVVRAVTELAARQLSTLVGHYGNPLRISEVIDSFEQFGRGSLPPDPLRPQDDEHQMNGPNMWFFWAAFADAAVRTGQDRVAWTWLGRLILLGAMNDGVFRGRYKVKGFSKDEAGMLGIRTHVRQLGDDEVWPELSRRFVDSAL